MEVTIQYFNTTNQGPIDSTRDGISTNKLWKYGAGCRICRGFDQSQRRSHAKRFGYGREMYSWKTGSANSFRFGFGIASYLTWTWVYELILNWLRYLNWTQIELGVSRSDLRGKFMWIEINLSTLKLNLYNSTGLKLNRVLTRRPWRWLASGDADGLGSDLQQEGASTAGAKQWRQQW